MWLLSGPLNHFKTFQPAVSLWLSLGNKALVFLIAIVTKDMTVSNWFLSAQWLSLTINVSKDL